MKCHHLDPFTHQILFAQTATFSASLLGGRDLPCSLHNHFSLCLLYLANNLTCLTNKAHRHLHPHVLFFQGLFALMYEDLALLHRGRLQCMQIGIFIICREKAQYISASFLLAACTEGYFLKLTVSGCVHVFIYHWKNVYHKMHLASWSKIKFVFFSMYLFCITTLT